MKRSAIRPVPFDGHLVWSTGPAKVAASVAGTPGRRRPFLVDEHHALALKGAAGTANAGFPSFNNADENR